MGFLQPIFLWGLAGISVPILIHLFSRRKSPVYFFSTVRFIKLTHRKTIRRQKLEEILVLLLRTVLVACLFIAIAQPISRRTILAEKESYVVLILDDSASMSAGPSQNVWKNLQKCSEQILASLRKTTSVCVVFTSGKTIPFSRIYQDVAKQIRASNPGFHGNTLQTALDTASFLLEKKSGYKKIFIITDFQKSAWEKVALAGKISADVTVIDAGEDYHENLTIKDFYPVPGKNTYICEMINWGKQQVTTELNISGENFHTVKQVNLPGEKTSEIEIKIGNDCQSLKAELAYPDILKIDNQFYLQRETSGEKKVLLIGSDDTSLFYTKSSVTSSGTIVVDTKKTNEISDVSFDQYRAIILVNPEKMEVSVREKLYQYISDGGTLIYFPGDRIAPEDFNNDWLHRGKNIFIMPAKLGRKNDFMKSAGVAWVATGHPLFTEFGEQTFDYLKTTRFNACYSVREITGDILMRLDNGNVVLIEKRIGKGKLFLFTFTPCQPWTNFHTRPFFPVMMTVMINYLSGITHSASVGNAVIVKGSENADSVNIINPEGTINTIKNTGKMPVSYVPDLPGIWTAHFIAKGNEQKQMVSVNVPYTEGNPSKISYGEIRTILRKTRVNFVSRNHMEKFIALETSGGNLMMVFLELAMVLLITELMLSNLFIFFKEKGTHASHKL
ncbi:MAG: BatA domain-containing protein [Candidatus Ratteibacteria bacterium]